MTGGGGNEAQFDQLDKTKFGWLHVKAILVAGIGYGEVMWKFNCIVIPPQFTLIKVLL